MAEFLSWDAPAQNAHIGNGIVMIGIVAAQTEPKIARCINDWYLADQETKPQKQQNVLDTMKRFPNYVPEAIILAVVEKQCGKFKRAKQS